MGLKFMKKPHKLWTNMQAIRFWGHKDYKNSFIGIYKEKIDIGVVRYFVLVGLDNNEKKIELEFDNFAHAKKQGWAIKVDNEQESYDAKKFENIKRIKNEK